ncbi:hypothetical protein Glove_88g136 [Diversispora epigaea]|uniref:Uncharacterized protein n=1 Tax=Diversispora epigaea TaxID=1348612 RepID=A0A397J9H7_9GLOM|nr:hypothetical protein Glove_88g136 [Diversispora epigaea]
MEIYEKNSDFYSETQNIYSNEFKENINELEEELTEFEEGLNEFEESNESEEESNESEKELNEQVYEFPELELFEYNKENYVKALMALEKETIKQFSDESENLEEQFNDESENLEIDFEIQVSQEILSNQKPVEEELVEEENEPVFKLDSTLKTQFSACVLIDYIDGKLQTCNQTANKNICQLVGTWQIDESKVLEFQSKRIPLGLRNWMQRTFMENMGEKYSNSMHWTLFITGSGKRKFTCEQRELHKDDVTKSLKLLSRWILYIANNETEEKKN